MSHIVNRGLKQDATLWTVTSNRSGGDAFSVPIPVKVRWTDVSERYIGSLDRQEHVSSSVVHLDRSARVGDYLVLGTSTALDPTLVQGAAKIQRMDKTPNLRNLLLNYKAFL